VGSTPTPAIRSGAAQVGRSCGGAATNDPRRSAPEALRRCTAPVPRRVRFKSGQGLRAGRPPGGGGAPVPRRGGSTPTTGSR